MRSEAERAAEPTPPADGAHGANTFVPSSPHQPSSPKDSADLRARTNRRSAKLIEAVFEHTLRQFQSGEERSKQLDVKAVALFSANGLSITVAVAFGSQTILGHPEYFAPIGIWGYRGVAAAFLVALGFGLASGICALQALTVQKRRAFDDAAIYDAQVLSSSDMENEADGVRKYQRFMIDHIWQTSTANTRLDADKAATIKRGQGYFLKFLGAILIMGLFIGIAAACSTADRIRGGSTHHDTSVKR